MTDADQRFVAFTEMHGERLRCLLVARYGLDVGNDVCNDALVYAWDHWSDVGRMANPVGYLFRVAQSASRKHFRWRRPLQLPVEDTVGVTEPEVELRGMLLRLPERQRVCVLMIHAFGWSYDDVAEALDLPVTAVRNHVHRGMSRLRRLEGELR